MPDRRPAAVPDSRKAAVLGSPITHSRSPQLHLAAYRALGLPSWTYERIECTAEQLPGLVSALGPEWVGLSVTMPGKFAALEFADQRTDRAQLVGSANTLVRMPTGGWRADNTDVDGVTGALGTAGDSALVIGSGGTAPAAVVALAELGVQRITIVARDEGKASRLVDLARRCGAQGGWCDIGGAALADAVASADAAVSTIPADAAAVYADALARVPRVLDAIYDPWPTPLAQAVEAAGGEAINGLQMLLNQAFAQVEQFTGMPAPKEAMRAALG
ncbi:shikimate dehydrogenase [Mycolicibacterium fortuitum]|uniref:shikimate dehydrogenase n=1 Tax=Mycolicibacterium fortuitum TaxID=1766 RepID=UPI000535A001|nr:shikimate dehydrogenase [Mycolicibacterium fortuitum]CRL54960.1 shikimate 5-dehydrogenase [Mycolicibacterium fortuitum subsp. fortuitum DSM 46621 = ATCC 6841 = JCM 6387]CRL82614.1 shikimate 5-dehydrogenase [Mycolicibacter nonchromogenicus]MDG5768935.1 shikimate dehydrogenase [Mycolicibacterium fortuitum]MDG5779579.1 shikimate dehydrogenase [Mycolicibacterium fortuitum]WEV35376.1 shikimate dehydrogenase [Mycolicibacterium fortuitum]